MLLEDIHVLVVEDVRSTRLQLTELAKAIGFKNVTDLENGKLAMGHLESLPCHLILCDWHMFPVSGIELLSWVRLNPKIKSIVFIMISAEKTKDYVVKAIQSGVNDYMIKPVSKEQLQSKVIGALTKEKVIS